MASAKYETVFYFDETGAPVTNHTGITLTYYVDEDGTAVAKPVPDKLPGTHNCYGFVPVMGTKAIHYVMDSGNDNVRPRRVSRYMRPEDYNADNADVATSTIPASPSAAVIADAVWDELLASHAISGSAGEALANAGAGSGAGSEVLTITVNDSTPALLEGASVWVKNAAGALVGTGTTGALGTVMVNPGPGDHTIYVRYPGLVFTATAKTVSAGVNASQTINGAAVSVPAASDPDLCAVYATIRNAAGAVVAGVTGTIQVTSLPALVSSSYLSDAQLSATSGADGVISWTVPRLMVGVVEVPGYIPQKTIVVPSQASAPLKDL